MNRKEFRKLTSSEDAKRIIGHIELNPDITELNIEDATGYVLAEDIVSPIDVPGFDRASMDGFAVRAKDTYSARENHPVTLDLAGKVEAGIFSEITVKPGTAVEISTGAMMPSGADSVVMVEYTNQKGSLIEIQRPVSINENVIHAGADIMIGERVLEAGTELTPGKVGILAALGMHKIKAKHLKLGIISTGNELAAPGIKLKPGQVYDINSYTIGAAARDCGAEVKYYGILADDRQVMEKALDRAVEECHLVFTSGSTSAGAGDIMYSIIEERGKLLLHGIDIKPGKPVIIGIVNDTPVFGLPGYPASALTIFNEFASPLIRRSLGLSGADKKIKATMAVGFRATGRRQLLPVGLIRGRAYPVDRGSGAITTLAYADGFVEIGPRVEMLSAGQDVVVTLLDTVRTPDILFIGSHCLGFEILMRLLPHRVRVINTGSTGGLAAVRDGIADVAGVHLLDENGVYNHSFMQKFGLQNAVLVKGYIREQGLLVRPDSNIRGLEDIPGRRMINRNRGSGTRVLTDMRLKRMAEEQGIKFEALCASIEGYDTEARTHSSVAAAVKMNKADAGLGIRPVAELHALKFIRLADEEYDFVLQKKFFESSIGQDFLEVLKSTAFGNNLPDGIRTYSRTGEICEIPGPK